MFFKKNRDFGKELLNYKEKLDRQHSTEDIETNVPMFETSPLELFNFLKHKNLNLFSIIHLRKRALFIVLLTSILKLLTSLIFHIVSIPSDLVESYNDFKLGKIIIDISDYVIILTIIFYIFISFKMSKWVSKMNIYYSKQYFETKEKIRKSRIYLLWIFGFKIVAFTVIWSLWWAKTPLSLNDVLEWPIFASVLSIFFFLYLLTIAGFISLLLVNKKLFLRDNNFIKSSLHNEEYLTDEEKAELTWSRMLSAIMFNVTGYELYKKQVTTFEDLIGALSITFVLRALGKKDRALPIHKLHPSKKWNRSYLKIAFEVDIENETPMNVLKEVAKKINKENKHLLSKNDIKKIFQGKISYNNDFQSYSNKLRRLNNHLSEKEHFKLLSLVIFTELSKYTNMLKELEVDEKRKNIWAIAEIIPSFKKELNKLNKRPNILDKKYDFTWYKKV